MKHWKVAWRTTATMGSSTASQEHLPAWRTTRKRWMPSLRHSAPATETLKASDGPAKMGG
ncbi:MAG: hypothetical protein IJW31_02365 [Lentisphaeria bacterium]|nr:hypothetical protein [Lentisphaeria bacterium]